MKRWIVFILALAALLLPARTTAAAAEQDSYAVAVGDVWFYASADEDEKLFLLPQTYYVRVLDEGELFCTVEYQTDDAPYKKLLGYCRTDALTFVDFVPVRPYLRKQITVTYTLPDTGGLGTDEFVSSERSFVYYGDRYEGDQLYLYVLSGDKFGYIPADAPPEYEHNDDYLQSTSGEGEEVPPAGNDAPGAVQIVVIVLACVAAVAVAVILLRGKKPPHEQQEF